MSLFQDLPFLSSTLHKVETKAGAKMIRARLLVKSQHDSKKALVVTSFFFSTAPPRLPWLCPDLVQLFVKVEDEAVNQNPYKTFYIYGYYPSVRGSHLCLKQSETCTWACLDLLSYFKFVHFNLVVPESKGKTPLTQC